MLGARAEGDKKTPGNDREFRTPPLELASALSIKRLVAIVPRHELFRLLVQYSEPLRVRGCPCVCVCVCVYVCVCVCVCVYASAVVGGGGSAQATKTQRSAPRSATGSPEAANLGPPQCQCVTVGRSVGVEVGGVLKCVVIGLICHRARIRVGTRRTESIYVCKN